MGRQLPVGNEDVSGWRCSRGYSRVASNTARADARALSAAIFAYRALGVMGEWQAGRIRSG